MILVDTPIWVDHIRSPDARMQAALSGRLVLTHPYVVGELALGNLRDRFRTLASWLDLPSPALATHEGVLDLIERERLHGSGLGYVDAHLLASALLSSGARLWTRDRRLATAAERLAVAA